MSNDPMEYYTDIGEALAFAEWELEKVHFTVRKDSNSHATKKVYVFYYKNRITLEVLTLSVPMP